MKKLGRILTIYFKASEQVIKDIGEDHLYNYEKEKNLERNSSHHYASFGYVI